MSGLFEKYKKIKQRVSAHPVVEAGRDISKIASDINKKLPGPRIDSIEFVTGKPKKKR